MMATVPHITSGFGLRKFQADGFLLTRVYLARQYTKDSILRSTVLSADIQKIHAPSQFAPQPSVFVFGANGKRLCVRFRADF